MLVDSAGRHGISMDHRSHNQFLRGAPNQDRSIIHPAETPLAGPNIQELIYTKGTFSSHGPLCPDRDQETEVLLDLGKGSGGRHTRKPTSARVANRVSVILLLILTRTRGHPQISVVTRPEALPQLIGTVEDSPWPRSKIRPLKVCRISLSDRSSFNLRGDSPQTGSSS